MANKNTGAPDEHDGKPTLNGAQDTFSIASMLAKAKDARTSGDPSNPEENTPEAGDPRESLHMALASFKDMIHSKSGDHQALADSFESCLKAAGYSKDSEGKSDDEETAEK